MNERIRNMMRLQRLFNRINYHQQLAGKEDFFALCHCLNQIYDLTVSRGDSKSLVLKELERQNQVMQRHSQTPDIDKAKLNTLLDQQKNLLDMLHNDTQPLGHQLKNDCLFNNIHHRNNTPGAFTDFDVPSVGLLLQQPIEKIQHIFSIWLKPYKNYREAINLCLKTIRHSALPQNLHSKVGYYEKISNDSSVIQIIKIDLDSQLAVYPEISSGKHRLTIRFFDFENSTERPSQTTRDIDFKLTDCSI